MLRSLFIVLFLINYVYTAEDNSLTGIVDDDTFAALPKTVQTELQKFSRAEQAAFQKYLATVQKEQEKVFRVIDREVKAITRKGDLDGANALQALHDELAEKQVVTDILGNPMIVNLSVREEQTRPANVILNNSWRSEDGSNTCAFDKENTSFTYGRHSGTYRVDGDRILLLFEGDKTERPVVLAKDGTSVTYSGRSGTYKLSIVRK